MASTVKSKKLMAKYRKDEDDDNAYVNTEFTIKDTTCDENDQPYYDQLDNTDHDTNHQKAKPNEYSQWGDRKISTDEIYENNEQSVSGVLQQKEVIHLQSKLPIPNSSKGLNIRHYKIGIGILAVICVILLVSLIAVAVILSASSKCEGLGCLNNGICTVVGGYMKCECLEGFSGLRCEVTPCSSNPCLHTGECTFGLNASNYVCSCPPGYAGESCQVTPCSSNPCQHNGLCIHNVNSTEYNCTCQRGFSGTDCQVTPCHSSPCQNSGVCRVVSNDYNCICLDGFTGPQCTDYSCDVEYTNGINCFLDFDIFSYNMDWSRINGSTPTLFTGPSSAAEGDFYFYFEADVGTRARLISRRMDTGYIKCLSFNYHMYGASMGTLYLYQDRDTLTFISGNQGNLWHFRRINIPAYVSRISFEARRGTFIYSDIAIDNITVTPDAC